MASLAETRSAIARVNTGKNANEDGWMTLVPKYTAVAHAHMVFSIAVCGVTQIGAISSSQRRYPSPYSAQSWLSLQAQTISVSILAAVYAEGYTLILDKALINTDDDVPYNWQYAKFPGSFKTCLMQMVKSSPPYLIRDAH